MAGWPKKRELGPLVKDVKKMLLNDIDSYGRIDYVNFTEGE